MLCRLREDRASADPALPSASSHWRANSALPLVEDQFHAAAFRRQMELWFATSRSSCCTSLRYVTKATSEVTSWTEKLGQG